MWMLHEKIATLLTLTSCQNNNTQHQPTSIYTLQELLDIALERRIGIKRPDHDRLLELTTGRETETITWEDFMSREPSGHGLTSEEAIYDVFAEGAGFGIGGE